MSGRRQFTNLRRKVEVREPKPRIVIYSEGEKTEYDYFVAMKKRYRTSLINIEIHEGEGVPLTIAKNAASAAKRHREGNRNQSFAQRDRFWAVFDRDEHPNIPEAMDICRGAKVDIAYSNPCFEVWLILHYEDYHKADNRHEAQKHFEKLCSDYDRKKRKTTDCEKLIDRVVAAEDRAEKQVSRRRDEGDESAPPSTTVFELTRQIRNPMAKKAKK